MPPRHVARLAFEYADDVWNRFWTSPITGDQRVDVNRILGTVHAANQRLGKTSGIEFTGVEEVPAAPIECRVHVGHKHLGEVTFVEDLTPPAVVVGHGRDNRSHALIRSDVEPPCLPFHNMALDLEARPQWLIDSNRAADLARRPKGCGV